jgi:hypothetical protein
LTPIVKTRAEHPYHNLGRVPPPRGFIAKYLSIKIRVKYFGGPNDEGLKFLEPQ